MKATDYISLILLLFIVYTYFGYPMLIYCAAKLWGRQPVRSNKRQPNVSVVMAARNEDRNIHDRIKNLIDQQYPLDRMEIIVVSDGSTDSTEIRLSELQERVRNSDRLPDGLLKVIVLPNPGGKPNALNKGMQSASGEIVVFADCRQRFDCGTISRLVENFEDLSVGCVSGELRFMESEGTDISKEMGAYWYFEKWLRKQESRLASVPGATGAIYAIRRNLYRPLPESTLLDDVLTPMQIALQGYRVVYDERALAYDFFSDSFNQEKRRKIRTLAGNWQTITLAPTLFLPSNPIMWQFWSHKIFRLMVPFVFLIMILTAIQSGSVFGWSIVAGSLVGLLLAGLSDKIEGTPLMGRLARLCRTIVFLNYCAFLAPFYLLWGRELWVSSSGRQG